MDQEERAERLKTLLNAAPKETQKGDYWEVDCANGRLIRHHVKKRKALFHPEHCRESPSGGWPLKQERDHGKKTVWGTTGRARAIEGCVG